MYGAYPPQNLWSSPSGWGTFANYGLSQLTGVTLPPVERWAPPVPWQVAPRTSRRGRVVESIKDIVLSIIEKVAAELRGSSRQALPPPIVNTYPQQLTPPLHPAYRELPLTPTSWVQAPAIPAVIHQAPSVFVSEQSTHVPLSFVASTRAEDTLQPDVQRQHVDPAILSTSSSSEEPELQAVLPNSKEDLTTPASYGQPPTPWPESPVRLPPRTKGSHECSVCGAQHTAA